MVAEQAEVLPCERFTQVALAIHGGAGVIKRENLTPSLEREFKDGLHAALQAGLKILREGGSALDIVETAVRSLEDCPLFNAGRGAVFTHDGNIELDAAIMDGRNRRAGAVASVTTLRNPVSAARAVMEQTSHVLLVGRGADEYCAAAGLETVSQSYFHTDARWKELQSIRSRKLKAQDPNILSPDSDVLAELEKFGTVGAVAVDAQGNLAAATSTGGMVNKQFGRVGDSPLIGCGTYADNRTCAVSATGHGEYFIRYVAAYDVSALMNYKSLSVSDAASTVIHETLKPAGGDGGLIALDAQGNCALAFNSEGMFRGCIKADGTDYVAIYRG